jgi:hypothetical protein
VFQRLISAQFAVAPPDAKGGRRARCSQRLETKPREHSRRADIPGIRNDEDVRTLMERPEAGGLFVLAESHD